MEKNSINLDEVTEVDNDYFKSRDIKLSISQSDFDILMYAFYHIDWSKYNSEEFGGEDSNAACLHLDDIEQQLYFEFN